MKPRFKLQLDGSMRCLASGRVQPEPIEAVIAKVKAQPTGPLPVAEYGKGMKSTDRRSMLPECVLRRQVVRAYGSIAEFQTASGIPGHVTNLLFKPWVAQRRGSTTAQLMERFGLEVHYRDKSPTPQGTQA